MAPHRSLPVAAAMVAVVGLLVPVVGIGVFDGGIVWLAVLLVAATALLVAIRLDRARDTDGDVWELIPNRQYTGRHAESGGLARDEQEAALSAVEEQAEARDRGRH